MRKISKGYSLALKAPVTTTGRQHSKIILFLREIRFEISNLLCCFYRKRKQNLGTLSQAIILNGALWVTGALCI